MDTGADLFKDIDPLNRVINKYGMSVAQGNARIPTISDLNIVLKVNGLILRRVDDPDGDLIEFTTEPVISTKTHKSYVLSLVPGLRVSDVASRKHQTSRTELLRNSLFLKEGHTQRIVDSADFTCSGPFTDSSAYQNSLREAVTKFFDKHM
jgi:hypothetical protein